MTKRGRPRHPDILTPREWEVLALLHEGLTNEQIADRLGVTLHAARYHVAEILSKLGVASREEAAAWEPPPPELRRAGAWAHALQIAVGVAALGALAGVVLLAVFAFRGSGDDDQVSAAASTSPTITPRAGAETPPPAETPEPSFVPSTRPDVGADIRSMQLTEHTGFVLTDDDLLRAAILEGDKTIAGPPVPITPPGVTTSDIRGFQFLDDETGWLVASGTPDDASQTLQLLVFRTDDGGDSWQSSSFSDSGFVYYEDRGRPADIDFIDADHGWIVLDTMATMNSPAGDLFRTADGGQTWTKLSVPAGDPVRFTDDQTGWQAAAPCSTCPVNRLYVTHDGGETWSSAFPTPTSTAPMLLAPVEYGLPVKIDDGSLLLPTTDPLDPDWSLTLMGSTDNGQTWDPVAHTNANASPEEVHLFPDGSVLAFSMDGHGYRLAADATEFTEFTLSQTGDVRPVAPGEGMPGLYDFDFVDSERGWALTSEGGCEQVKSQCWTVSFIEQTDDGGGTWSALPMPGPIPTLSP